MSDLDMPEGWGTYYATIERSGRWSWTVEAHHGISSAYKFGVLGEKRAERVARRWVAKLQRQHERTAGTRRTVA